MPENNELLATLKTVGKFALIGAALAFIVAYFLGENTDVAQFIEISKEDAKELAEEHINSGSHTVSYASSVKNAAPAVVNIYTTKKAPKNLSPFRNDPIFKRFFGDEPPEGPRDRLENSLGSGVIISSQGYLLTNNHVIQGADEIQIALQDGRNTKATVVGTDPESDIAVLKIELPDLPSITLGQSDVLEVGDVVLAIGNPFGVGQTVTMGIVSATGRDRLGLTTFENFIQTDAAINPGNSGGALINAYGHLIGINTAIFTRSGGSQGIGFAIPITSAKDITEQIIEKGHVIRGWIGIEIQDISPALAESFNLNEAKGVIVAGVLRQGPADKAGMKPGDIIIAIQGTEIEDGRHAVKLISKSPPGSNITISALRNGKKITVSTTTEQRPIIEKKR